MSDDQEQVLAPPAAAPINGVGTLLRQAREERGQDLESVARALRIRHPYLVAIEEGRYSDLPGAPYASGFVRSYAEFLGLDAPEILRRFREESGGLGGRTELVFPAPVSEGGFPAAVLIGLVIILAAVVYGVWYFYQWRHSGSAESVSELPDRLTALIHAPGGEDRPSAGDAQASPATPESTTTLRANTDKAGSAPTPAPAQASAPAPADSAMTTASLAPSPSPAPTTAPAPATTTQPAAASPSPTPAPAASSAAPAPAPVSAPVAASNAGTPAATQAAAPQAQPPAPAAADANKTESVADATPPPTMTPTSPGQAAPPAPDLGLPSRVVLRATDDCWIEIRDPTGAIVSSRLLRKGDTYPVPPRPGLSLTVGNAGALTLLLDGAALPPLGKSGMVRHDIALDPDRVGTPASTTSSVPAGD